MEIGDDRVARIVYASESNLQGSAYVEMERIRASALRHNVPLGVCTALLSQSGHFVQWKEGPVDALVKVMDRVQADPRHRNLCVVHSSRGPRLLCGPWSMAIVDAREHPAEMQKRVAWAHHCALEGRQYPLPAVWRHLSTPHAAAERPGGIDRFQRIMVCGTETRDAFELVQWLGRRFGGTVVHRRFAGEEGLDVGTDYVDFEEDGRAYRVIAMARNGLLLPLTRAFVSDYSRLVLLLSGDAQKDLGLVHRVGEACAQLRAPPPVAGVALEPEVHAGVLALAAHCRLKYSPVHANPEYALGVWQALRSLREWSDTVPSDGDLEAFPG